MPNYTFLAHFKPLAWRPEAQIGESAYPVSPIGDFDTIS